MAAPVACRINKAGDFNLISGLYRFIAAIMYLT